MRIKQNTRTMGGGGGVDDEESLFNTEPSLHGEMF